jgi:hypothetical protein
MSAWEISSTKVAFLGHEPLFDLTLGPIATCLQSTKLLSRPIEGRQRLMMQ